MIGVVLRQKKVRKEMWEAGVRLRHQGAFYMVQGVLQWHLAVQTPLSRGMACAPLGHQSSKWWRKERGMDLKSTFLKWEAGMFNRDHKEYGHIIKTASSYILLNHEQVRQLKLVATLHWCLYIHIYAHARTHTHRATQTHACNKVLQNTWLHDSQIYK